MGRAVCVRFTTTMQIAMVDRLAASMDGLAREIRRARVAVTCDIAETAAVARGARAGGAALRRG